MRRSKRSTLPSLFSRSRRETSKERPEYSDSTCFALRAPRIAPVTAGFEASMRWRPSRRTSVAVADFAQAFNEGEILVMNKLVLPS